MASAYLRGRTLRPVDLDAWAAAARPHLPTAGRLLDLGAGTGRFSAVLADACGASVVACEPSAAMRAACPAGLTVVGGAAEHLPFAAGSFDAVWASQVVHHVADLPAFARDLRRVLRPGGPFLVRGGFGPVSDLPLHRWFPRAWSTFSPSLAELTDLLAGVGLRRVARVAVGQLFAADAAELVAKVRSRSLSPLAGLPDPEFHAGLSRLEIEVDGLEFPLAERLDLVVYR